MPARCPFARLGGPHGPIAARSRGGPDHVAPCEDSDDGGWRVVSDHNEPPEPELAHVIHGFAKRGAVVHHGGWARDPVAYAVACPPPHEIPYGHNAMQRALGVDDRVPLVGDRKNERSTSVPRPPRTHLHAPLPARDHGSSWRRGDDDRFPVGSMGPLTRTSTPRSRASVRAIRSSPRPTLPVARLRAAGPR